MNIDALTLGQIKEIQAIKALGTPQITVGPHPFMIGSHYMIRTVTHIDIGTLLSVGPQEIVLVNASWIADTGRFSNAIKEGTLSEVEPYPDGLEVIIGRSAIVDACRWMHELPRIQK